MNGICGQHGAFSSTTGLCPQCCTGANVGGFMAVPGGVVIDTGEIHRAPLLHQIADLEANLAAERVAREEAERELGAAMDQLREADREIGVWRATQKGNLEEIARLHSALTASEAARERLRALLDATGTEEPAPCPTCHGIGRVRLEPNPTSLPNRTERCPKCRGTGAPPQAPGSEPAPVVAAGQDGAARIILPEPVRCGCGRMVTMVVNREGRSRCVDCDAAASPSPEDPQRKEPSDG